MKSPANFFSSAIVAVLRNFGISLITNEHMVGDHLHYNDDDKNAVGDDDDGDDDQ